MSPIAFEYFIEIFGFTAIISGEGAHPYTRPRAIAKSTASVYLGDAFNRIQTSISYPLLLPTTFTRCCINSCPRLHRNRFARQEVRVQLPPTLHQLVHSLFGSRLGAFIILFHSSNDVLHRLLRLVIRMAGKSIGDMREQNDKLSLLRISAVSK